MDHSRNQCGRRLPASAVACWRPTGRPEPATRAIVAVALALAAAAAAPALGVGTTQAWAEVLGRVSVASDGAQSNASAHDAVISADGRIVAFDSEASNLVPGLPGCTFGISSAIFVHDRQTRQTTCASVATNGAPATGGDSLNPALSTDGRFVAFESRATNLFAGATSGVSQVYVRDRLAGTTTLASTADGTTPGDSDSTLARISSDGGFVAFASSGIDLSPSCVNGNRHIFLRDRNVGVTSCVSVGPGGVAGNGDSQFSALSADGRFVAFDSFATNIVPGCGDGSVKQVYLLDRMGGTVECVSLGSDGTPARGAKPAVSNDGSVVVFTSPATNLAAPCTNGFWHIFVRDRQAGTTTCITRAPNGSPANEQSDRLPAVSADGRFVTFVSLATNLVTSPTVLGGLWQVYVHDRNKATMTLISVGPDGSPGLGNSVRPSVSSGGDARFAVFGSQAANLVPGDTNGVQDTFVARLASGPNWLVTGAASGGTPIRGFDALGQTTLLTFDPGFTSGVHVALGDVNGDGAPDLIVGAGNAPGQDPRVRVFSGSTAETLLVDFDANGGAPGGVRVAACDLGGTGRAHIVTGPGPGGGTQVRVWEFDPGTGSVTQRASFAAYAVSPGGVFVACGHLDGPDSPPSIITGPGPGSAPLVKVFSVDLAGGTATERTSFEAYPASFTGGVSVGAGDVRRRGRASIVTGPGPGSPPLVRVWTLGLAPLTAGLPGPRQVSDTVTDDGSVLVGDPNSVTGINVGAGDTTGTGETIVTGSGPGDPSQISTVDLGGTTPGEPVPISLPGTGGVVPAAPPGTSSLPPLPLDLRLNQTSLHPGDALRLDVVVTNPNPAVVVDAYLGVLLPGPVGPAFGCPAGDALALVTSEGLLLTCLSAPQTFRPRFQGVTVPANLPMTLVPNVFATPVPLGAPAGTYRMGLALTQPGTLNVLTLTFTSFVIIP